MQAFTVTINFPNSSDWPCDQNYLKLTLIWKKAFHLKPASTEDYGSFEKKSLLLIDVGPMWIWPKGMFSGASMVYTNDLFLVERIPLPRSWYSLNVMKIRSKDLHIFICLPFGILDSVVFCVFISSCRLLVIFSLFFFFLHLLKEMKLVFIL